MSTETMPDPLIGTTVERSDGTKGVVVRREGHALSINWSDGKAGYLSVRLVRLEALKHKTTGPQSLDDLITKSCVARHLGLDRQAVARDVLLKLEAIRDGIEPAELTDADKKRILDRLAKDDAPPPDAQTIAAIRRNLSASEPDSFEDDVRSHIIRLNKRGR